MKKFIHNSKEFVIWALHILPVILVILLGLAFVVDMFQQTLTDKYVFMHKVLKMPPSQQDTFSILVTVYVSLAAIFAIRYIGRGWRKYEPAT